MFDLAGRLVRTLVDGKRPAGVQSIVWDLRDDAGRAVPAGLYRCRLAAAGASEQRRFVVIR